MRIHCRLNEKQEEVLRGMRPVDVAEENLENLRAQLAYWTKLKSGVFAEVPAETEE